MTARNRFVEALKRAVHARGLTYAALGGSLRLSEATVKRMFSLIWAISAGVAAIAGVLLAPVSLIDINLGFIGLKSFAAAVLGGFGSIPGALVGGVTIGLIELFSGVYLPQGFKDVAAYIVLLLVLAIRPQGLFGTVGRKKV